MDIVFHLAVRASLALLLAAAATHKLGDLARFRAVLAGYEVLPTRVVPAVAMLVASVEAALALLLATGFAPQVAGVVAAKLMLVYAAAIFINVRRVRTDIDCGCMGPASRAPLGYALVVRNVVLAAAALTLTLPVSSRAPGWLDAFGVVAATLTLAMCWLASERTLALAPRAAMLRHRMQRGAR